VKTGFFKQVRELKIQRKNPGRAFTDMKIIWLVFGINYWYDFSFYQCGN
jgi:hypothetical protein